MSPVQADGVSAGAASTRTIAKSSQSTQMRPRIRNFPRRNLRVLSNPVAAGLLLGFQHSPQHARPADRQPPLGSYFERLVSGIGVRHPHAEFLRLVKAPVG